MNRRHIMDISAVVTVRDTDQQIVSSYTVVSSVAIDISSKSAGEIVDATLDDLSEDASNHAKRMLNHIKNGCSS